MTIFEYREGFMDVGLEVSERQLLGVIKAAKDLFIWRSILIFIGNFKYTDW